ERGVCMTPAVQPPTEIREKVQGVIDLIRPAVQAEGGAIELVDVMEDGTVASRFHGACRRCTGNTVKMRMVLERKWCEKVGGERRGGGRGWEVGGEGSGVMESGCVVCVSGCAAGWVRARAGRGRGHAVARWGPLERWWHVVWAGGCGRRIG